MTMRITGMNSGLDTESIITELVKAKSTKVETLKKEKTKYEWKQETWTSLNKKIKSFYSSLSNFRFTSSYRKKTTSVSNPNAVSVITGEAAMNGVQELTVNSLAKSGYLTGAKINYTGSESLSGSTTLSELSLASDTEGKLTALTTDGGSFTVTANGKSTSITVKSGSTISEVVTAMKSAGVDANYDEKQNRIFVASSKSGYDTDFTLTADNAQGFTALSVLGLNEALGTSTDTTENANAKTLSQYKSYAALTSSLTSLPTKTIEVEEEYEEEGETKTRTVSKTVTDSESFLSGLDTNSDLYKAIKAEMTAEEIEKDDYTGAIERLADKAAFANEIVNGSTYSSELYSSDAVRIAGSDCTITLNGVDYSSNTNNVEVNGLTFTCLATTSDPVTITTQDDTDGVYDMIKGLMKQYNELINEMDKLYNADSAKDYEPLTDEEKDAMTDTEIEKWETTIKDALLRKDSSLGTVFNSMKTMMLSTYTINDKSVNLSTFGIETLSYFLAKENEHGAYHIAGDPDDDEVSTESDKLKTAIANDPDTVISYFTKLAQDMYKKLTELGASSDYSSSSSWFEDKKYKTDISGYTSKISDAEDKLSAYEDKYYKKFASMETALAKLESSTSSITSLLGS